MAVILGIDPGSRKTGYGVVRMVGNEITYLGSGCIVTGTSEDPLHKRLLVIYEAVGEIITQFKPDEMAVEQTFLSKNVQSTIKLSEARAVALVTGAKAGIEVFEYTPTQIKQAVVGYGQAEKTQVQFMVKTLLKLSGTPQADAADALACAICHGYTNKVARVMNSSMKVSSATNAARMPMAYRV